MYPAAETEIKLVYKEPLFGDEYHFDDCFHSIEENTALKCIRTVAATYGCKILRLRIRVRIRSELRKIPKEYQFIQLNIIGLTSFCIFEAVHVPKFKK